jgi:predicted phosphodiesterase
VRALGVIADAHANLPATVAARDALDAAGCELIVHAGDAIGIGPHPGETLALLLDRGVRCVMGNHDEWFAWGLPHPPAEWMPAREARHHRWVHAQLSPTQRDAVRAWPDAVDAPLGSATATVLHYARAADGRFAYLPDPTTADLASLFADAAGDVVVFGHDHRARDVRDGRRRFVAPGSLGCHDRAEARAVVLLAEEDGVAVRKVAVPYDDAAFLADFERRDVPERDFIRRTFVLRR